MYQTGISTASMYGKMYTEDALEFYAKNNVDCAEVFLASFSEYTESFGKELLKIRGNTEIYSVHTLNSQCEGRLFSRSERQYKDALKIFTSALNVGKMLDAKVYVMHGPAQMKYTKYVTNYEFFGARTAELYRIAKDYGITLTWENVHWAHYDHPQFMRNLRAYCSEPVGCTLDIKQAVQSGVTADKYIEDMDGNIKNIHVLDMAEDGKLLLPGKGCFDFKALLERVGDYSGKVMIEVYDGSFTKPEELIESYAWLKSELGK